MRRSTFLKFPVDCGIGQESGAYCSPRGAEGWNAKGVGLHTSLVVVDVFVVSSRPHVHPHKKGEQAGGREW